MVSENHGSEVFDDFVSLVMSQSYCSLPLLQVYMSTSRLKYTRLTSWPP